MKILVVGSGGREHAIVKKMKENPAVKEVFALPGNGGMSFDATCIDIKDAEGSWYFTFRYAFDKEMAKRGYITVDKGSVTVNGVSLTVCNPTDDTFQVAIIPYTYEYTNFHTFTIGSVVNIEFDIIGKYISRMIQYK